jgi:pimeloyl-ACP methyl ester carboxylesterase
MSIPYTTYNDHATTPILFAHANGYPPACYTPLFGLLKDYKIMAIHQRPLWQGSKPEELDDWHPLSDDLLHFMDEKKLDKTMAIGHSMGGIAVLRAALRDLNRFSRIILLDPVLFPPYFIRMWQVIRALKLGHKLHPLVPVSRRRRRVFKNRELIFRGYRKKNVFRYFSDEALEAYINGITCPVNDGTFKLCYPAEWETQIYVTGVSSDMELWRGLPKLGIPLLVLRGAETDTFYETAGKLVKKKLPGAKVITIPNSTHLVPLEQPNKVAREIKSFLRIT